ncbi:MAG: hypothetical protein HQM12_24105, partial [SAR324 cluster bacterium]|nr:hypothetical protein [SAR324 cluster bacterium]
MIIKWRLLWEILIFSPAHGLKFVFNNHPTLKSILILLLFILGGPHVVNAQEILVFSTSHKNDGISVETQPEGLLVIEISTFAPIVQILINDTSIDIQRRTRAHIEMPYQLKPGANPFDVLVKTALSEQTKTFVLQFSEPVDASSSISDKKAFQFITLIGSRVSDNVENTWDNSNKKVGTKAVLMMIPGYRWFLDETSTFTLKSVVLREWLDLPDVDSDLAYSEISGEWFKKSGSNEWRNVMGLTDIGKDTQGFTALRHVESNVFASGMFKHQFNESNFSEIQFRMTARQLETIDNENYEGNGLQYYLSASWGTFDSRIDSKLLVAYEMNDSLGQYQD